MKIETSAKPRQKSISLGARVDFVRGAARMAVAATSIMLKANRFTCGERAKRLPLRAARCGVDRWKS